VVRVDWATRAYETFQAPPLHYFGGEPFFVPHPSRQDEGVVVCQLFDAEHGRSSFVVFDAFNLSAGPIATLRAPSAVPLLFHSLFHPDGA
jgi:carotenoid cleavage dioxygenase-like enzyme